MWEKSSLSFIYMILLQIFLNLIDMHGKNISKKELLWFISNKERNPAIYDNVDEPWGHYIKWNKSDRDIPHDLTYIWSLKHTHAKSLQSCSTLCNSMECSPPVSSVHGILQARTLGWVTIPFSRGSFQPRDWTQFSHSFCTAGRFFTTGSLGKPPYTPTQTELRDREQIHVCQRWGLWGKWMKMVKRYKLPVIK